MREANSVDTKRFRILAKLGQGGMGDVYLAVAAGPHGFSKLVVVKQVRDEMKRNEAVLRMFAQEARVAARLNHPNIVHTYEVSEDDDGPMMVMEYLEGQPLSRIAEHGWVAGTPIPRSLHLRVLIGVLEGLHCVHELADYDGSPLCLVHRDVSPQNVFVTFDGQVKLLDFGIAKAPGARSETRPGDVKGKLGFMAPEQMLGERLDRRADIYAVGVMLWEAVAGRELWDKDEQFVMRKSIDGAIPKLAELDPNAPAELQRIVDKALAPYRKDRYATAAEMLRDLEAHITRAEAHSTQRELGAFVSTMFCDVRAQRRALIESQLGRISLAEGYDSGRHPIDLPTPVPPAALGKRDGDAESLLSTIAAIRSAKVEPTRSRRRRAWVALACLLAALAVVALFGRWRSAGRRPLPVAAVPFVDTPKPAATPASPLAPAGFASHAAASSAAPSVEITISVSPPEATIYWDAHALPSNPRTERLARDGSRHTVRAAAKGYVDRSVEVTLDESGQIVLTLGRASISPPQRPKSVASAIMPTVNCDPPYYVDSRGIRKAKPECL
jgi:serine/threonine protein kinase